MKLLQQFKIPFTGLKIGKHLFEFAIDERFFNEFEYSLVKNGSLKALVELDKQETLIILNFTISGEIMVSCDVCLSEFPLPVTIQERQIVKFAGGEESEDTDEIVVLNRYDHEIDVSSLIYEYITLAVPYISRCSDAGDEECRDKEMISRLQALSGQSAEEEKVEEDADPRWEALKKIKNK